LDNEAAISPYLMLPSQSSKVASSRAPSPHPAVQRFALAGRRAAIAAL